MHVWHKYINTHFKNDPTSSEMPQKRYLISIIAFNRGMHAEFFTGSFSL